jgi:[ribosomal protein S18]-alanine N-acetyltransferase
VADNLQWHIRHPVDEDLDAVVELESLCFSDPWPREALAVEITAHERRLSLVLEVEGRVRGVALVWVVADELHIVSLGVHPELRRRGAASALLEALRHSEVGQRGSLMTLEVRERNEGAIAFYARHGFLAVARRPRYYPDTREAAVVMILPLKVGGNEGGPSR